MIEPQELGALSAWRAAGPDRFYHVGVPRQPGPRAAPRVTLAEVRDGQRFEAAFASVSAALVAIARSLIPWQVAPAEEPEPPAPVGLPARLQRARYRSRAPKQWRPRV